MAFALLSRARSKPQDSVKPATKQKSAGRQHPADSRFAKPVFQPQTAALPTAPEIQTKLKVGEPDDEFEQEVDRVADAVTRMLDPRRTEDAEMAPHDHHTPQRVSRTMSSQSAVLALSAGHDVPPIVHEVLRSPGQPLDPVTRAFMEPRFGHDFSDVRVHTDTRAAKSARAVDAQAYTVGQNVVFSEGYYTPHLRQGSKLLAHELAHVIQQQRRGASLPGLRGGGLEREADAAASALVKSSGFIHVGGASAPGLARQPLSGSFGLTAKKQPRSLEESLSKTEQDLSDWQLEDEISLILEWLLDNPATTTPHHDHLKSELEALQAERSRRKGEKKKRRKAEERRQERFQEKWARYSHEILDEKIARTRAELKDQPESDAARTLLERLEKERARRRDVRRARPVTGPKTWAEAVSMIKEAWRDAEKEQPPDLKHALELVSRVNDWLERTANSETYEEFFRGLPLGVDSARMSIGMTKTNVKQLMYYLKVDIDAGRAGVPIGYWKPTINALESKQVSEILKVMSGETKLQSTSFYAESKALGTRLKYTAAAYAAVPAAPLVVKGVIAAAPLTAGEGAVGWGLFRTALKVAPRASIWALGKPVLAGAIVTGGASTALDVGETGTVNPFQLAFNLLHIRQAQLSSKPPSRFGPGASEDTPPSSHSGPTPTQRTTPHEVKTPSAPLSKPVSTMPPKAVEPAPPVPARPATPAFGVTSTTVPEATPPVASTSRAPGSSLGRSWLGRAGRNIATSTALAAQDVPALSGNPGAPNLVLVTGNSPPVAPSVANAPTPATTVTPLRSVAPFQRIDVTQGRQFPAPPVQPAAATATPARTAVSPAQPAVAPAQVVPTPPAAPVPGPQTARLESTGARSTARASSAARLKIAEAAAMGLLNPALAVPGANVATATSRTAQSQTTAIRAQTAEVSAYEKRLSRGEIGLLAPVGANIRGADYATAVRLPNGDYEVVVADAKSRVSDTSAFGAVRQTLSTAWENAVADAIAPVRLNLGDRLLEQAIRDAWAQRRVRIARDTIDYSPQGKGDRIRLDN